MSVGTRAAFALVGLGGTVGGLGRYALTHAFPEPAHGVPWTTWAINVSGSFLLGFLVAGVVGRRAAPAWVRPALGTGVLGGYTTFSAYAHAVDVLATGGRPGTAAVYLALSVVGGVLAAAAGTALGARLPARDVGARLAEDHPVAGPSSTGATPRSGAGSES